MNLLKRLILGAVLTVFLGVCQAQTIPANRIRGNTVGNIMYFDLINGRIVGTDQIPSGGSGDINLGAANSLGWNNDVILWRDGPWELALRDGTNDNFFYIYGTFTDPSNYERLALYAGSSSEHFLEPQSAGTGTANIQLTIRSLGNSVLTFGNTTNRPSIQYNATNMNQIMDFSMSRSWGRNAPELTGLSGATATFTNIRVAGHLIQAVKCRINTTITGAATFDIGDGVNPDRWGAAIGPTAGTISGLADYDGTDVGPFYNPTTADIVLTANGGSFTGGDVRCATYSSTFGGPGS